MLVNNNIKSSVFNPPVCFRNYCILGAEVEDIPVILSFSCLLQFFYVKLPDKNLKLKSKHTSTHSLNNGIFICVSTVRIDALPCAFPIMLLTVPSHVPQRSSQVKLIKFPNLCACLDSKTQKSWFTTIENV